MYAIIQSGGKQYKVSPGNVVDVEKLPQEPSQELIFDKVLLISSDSDVKIGTPYIEKAQVKAKVLEHGKEKKVVVFKYKSKTGYRRKRGHRQPFTRVQIEEIKT